MNLPDSPKSNLPPDRDPEKLTALDLQIEAWLDGDLDAESADAVVDAMRRDPAMADRARAARTVHELLRSAPAETFPEERLASVLATARREARHDVWRRMRAIVLEPFGHGWRPALAMAALAVVMVVAVVTGGRPRPVERPPDPAVAQALDQVRWTLGFLADVGRRTGRSVREDVLEPHVVTPVEDAVAHVFEPPQTEN